MVSQFPGQLQFLLLGQRRDVLDVGLSVVFAEPPPAAVGTGVVQSAELLTGTLGLAFLTGLVFACTRLATIGLTAEAAKAV